MSLKKDVVPEYRTLSPVDTHDYWKELCNKEDLRRTNFTRKFKRGVSYSKPALRRYRYLQWIWGLRREEREYSQLS